MLRHAILIFNPIQNPDGRVAGTRVNGNGFDLNRDYLTQSQSETRASITLMKRWLPPEVLDLHGYVSPTLIEATTKPHNPSIEYDLWLKWNQPRIDSNEAAVNAIGTTVTRPINDWCADGDAIPTPGGDGARGGTAPGPAVAEGWDDWGPFYTARCTRSTWVWTRRPSRCASSQRPGTGRLPTCGGRAGSRDVSRSRPAVDVRRSWSRNRADMLHDELEMYRRGDVDAPRPACCPPPFDVDHNWMQDYPTGVRDPARRGPAQRRRGEPARRSGCCSTTSRSTSSSSDYRFNGHTFEEDSYVAWIAQPRRGLLDTAMSIGVDISDRISILYAPPAAWSHGYLWGADVVTIPDGARFSPRTERIKRPNRLDGGVVKKRKRATGYALEVDSPTAVRAVNELVRGGAEAWIATRAVQCRPGRHGDLPRCEATRSTTSVRSTG